MRFTFLSAFLLFALAGFSQKSYLFVGTYTEGGFKNGESKGIYVYKFDGATGDLQLVSTTATENPSYLALADGGKMLYAVNETGGSKPGSVSAFSFDKKTGQLKFINKQATGGDAPCYVSVDAHRKWALVANYSGGNFSALPIAADGSLKPSTQTIQHTGSGADKSRQEKAHVHSAILSPDEKHVLVCDLGIDRLSLLNFNAAAAQKPLTPTADSALAVSPGEGPRHTCFYPGKPYVYLITELKGTVDVFQFTGGRLKQIQQVSSHPAGYKGDIGSADIHISPNGKFLYASNRGDANNIAIFAIDPATGKLTLKGFQSTEGKTPRNFMIDPTGRWLLAANQNGKNVVVFKINQETGLLTDTGKRLELPAPVCLKMTPIQ
ncbi:MAG: lactonase family protein [Bacteroidetes bacterium]|nr:lactonase family protein [Bacteroidota bacterium]